jgi:microcystin-dependent protein
MLTLPARAAAFARRLFLKRFSTAAGGLLAGLGPALLGARPARAGTLEYAMDPYLGEIVLIPRYLKPGSAAPGIPVGWLPCDGALLSIRQYLGLYSLLGITYGGDGQTTFALPDLRGRVPLGAGAGPGLATYPLGKRGGEAAHVLTPAELPTHTHPVPLSYAPGTVAAPAGNYLASNAAGLPQYAPGGETQTAGSAANAPAAHNNLQPYLAFQFIISVQGVFPTRD